MGISVLSNRLVNYALDNGADIRTIYDSVQDITARSNPTIITISPESLTVFPGNRILAAQVDDEIIANEMKKLKDVVFSSMNRPSARRYAAKHLLGIPHISLANLDRRNDPESELQQARSRLDSTPLSIDLTPAKIELPSIRNSRRR